MLDNSLKDKNLYYIGGVVRDEFLGISSFDIDYCYEGNAIEFAKNLNVIKTNSEFGTVRVIYDNKEIDIASTREESYPKAGHLPQVKNIGCSLKDDLKRRDFTINAMAKNTQTGEIIDFYGGLNDIQTKTLRVLHNKSFIDDPSRILRALKFSVRFGFELDDTTEKLQTEYLNNINYDMSYHRIKKELKETFNLNIEKAYTKFINQGIYKLLGPNQEIPKIQESISTLIDKYKPNIPWIIYLGLFDLERLELNGEEKRIIESVPKTKPNSDYETYIMFEGLPLESIILYGLSVDYNAAITYLDKLKNIKIEITGEDLKEIRIPEGKIYKEIFDYVLKEKLKQPQMSKNEELELVQTKYNEDCNGTF